MSTLRSRAFYRRLREFRADAEVHELSVYAKRLNETTTVEDEESPSAYLDLLSEMVRKMSRAERQKQFQATLDMFDFYGAKFADVIPTNNLRRAFRWLLHGTDSVGSVELAEFFSEQEAKLVLNRFGFAYTYEREYFGRCFYKLKDVKVHGQCLKYEISRKILRSGSLRKQMLLETLVALFTTCSGKAYLSLLWKALPYPFISTAEMSSLLEPFFRGSRLQLRDFCEEYRNRNCIFKVPEVGRPRSLLHLCRVQVRESLSHRGIGDDAVDCLPIPSVLVGYLKLDSF